MAQNYLAAIAADWLEQTLLPLAFTAARLPEGTTIDAVVSLQLPQPDHAFSAHSTAVMHSANLLLVGATLTATELAQNEHTSQLARCILGLIWRDALELAIARDLDFDSGVAGFPSGDFQLRHDLAQDVWERWQQTDAAVQHATIAFFQACGDAWNDHLYD